MPVIELDMLVAYVNSSDRLHGAAVRVFERVMKGELEGVAVPTSAYLEYGLVLRSRGYSEEDVLEDIEGFRELRNLRELPLTSKVLARAARLRVDYGLTFFDSLHAASALLYDGTIISVDKAYRKVQGLRVLDPRYV